jgi:hypothetical protein
VSAKEFVDIRVFGAAQRFVSAAENYFALPHHHHLAVDEAEAFAFTLEHDLAVFVNYRVLGTDVLHVVHFVRNED